MTGKVKLKIKELIKKKDFDGMKKTLSNYDCGYDIDTTFFIYSIKVNNMQTAKFFYDRIFEVCLEYKNNNHFVKHIEFLLEEFGDKITFSTTGDLYRLSGDEKFLPDTVKEMFLF